MMRTALIIGFVLVSFVFTAAAQTKADWINYKSPGGRYSIMVPEEPKLSQQEATAKTGEKFPQYLANIADGKGVFLVGFFDMLPGSTFSLDEGRNGMLQAVNGKLLSEKSISLGGSPGREAMVAATFEGIDFLAHVRFYVVERRVYILQHIFPKSEGGSVNDQKSGKFFDSFKVETVQ